MKIACIGWGSLIWDPRHLKISNKWETDGPSLPIEFTRVSRDKRVTLIIDIEAKPVRTLWAEMSVTDLNEATDNLRKREHTTIENIYWIRKTDETDNSVKQLIKDWLVGKEFDAAIWTGLSYSESTNGKRPTITEIISHLKSLSEIELKTAKQYICKAPGQIDTEYRKEIYSLFDWFDLD